MRRFVGASLVLLASFLLANRLESQSPQQPPSFRAGVDIVQLDVSVLDEQRRPIKGLSAADFTVLENGVAQPIVAFDAVEIPDPVDPPAAWMRDVPPDVATNDNHERRVIVIVLDDAFMPLDAGPMAKKIARAVVDGMGPADIGAITFTDSGRRQDVTTDRRRLLKAIDSLVPHPQSLPCRYRGRFHSNASCVMDTLITAADALGSVTEGRKTLVYISGGVPFDFSMTEMRGPDNPAEEMLAVRQMLHSLQQGNVNVYAIDPSGLTPAGIMSPALDSLRMFAEQTGGRATIATNTPWQAVPQIFRENSSYYLLGIRSPAAAREGTFRRVQVKVNRPGAEVRTRGGYFANSPRIARAASAAVEDAIANPTAGGALPLRVAVAPFASADDRTSAVAIVVGLPQLPDARRTFDVLVMALDADCGDCRKLPSQRQSVTVPALGSGVSPQTEVVSRLDLRPGSYEIRVAAAAEGSSGSVLTHVDVPSFDREKFTGSGLILSTAADTPSTEARAGGGVVPLVPTSVREFRPDAHVTAFMRFHQRGSKPTSVRVTATIRDSADHVNFDRTTLVDGAEFARTRSADFRLDLPLSKLEAGEHLLTIDGHLGKIEVRRDARFVVR